MRYLRAKGIRKALRQFHFLCGLKAPYKVLLDGNFIAMCVQMKVDVRERVPKYLQVKAPDCELFVPRAALDELRVLGEATKEAYDLAKTFTVAEAYDQAERGQDQPVDVSKHIQSIIGDRNERKFVVCTQEVELRKALRLVPGVPLLYLNRSVLVFEEISRATLAIVRQEEKANMAKLDVNEKRKLEQMQEGEKGADHAEQQRLQKKRAKGPNPLSMKKSAKKKVRAKKKKN
ncbi:Small subunit processome component [Phytophthora pseudosyringae]|uniref:Small subunit processome component n=1 Tax=Phytophthora pseudosyringae TaxID=221518 RepID=A0A8T1WBH1_9STRA|nr:Small subunit processome component [Phytophthora pseudosyringae]